MSPRALIVAYDFPPHGAIGTMRTLRLVRELSREGWEITVVTGAPETYLPGTPVEPGLQSLVPEKVRVIPVPAVRGLDALTRTAKRLRAGTAPAKDQRSGAASTAAGREPTRGAVRRTIDWVDAALSIPDNEAGWIVPATIRGLRQVLSSVSRPDVIYSSAPPWSGQVVAWALALVSRRPWVADFRDPWSRAPWRDWRKPFRQRAAAWFERRVIGRADAVLFVTRANLEEFAAHYGPSTARRLHLVPNGCDPAELEHVPSRPAGDAFVLLHAGTLYGARNPMPVIEAVARALHRGALERRRFRLRFVGTISLSTDLGAECRRLGIADVVEFVPRVTRAESLRELKSASALLLVQTGTTVSVPGKAYEYLAAGRPILALSEEGETAELVRASGIGRSVAPSAGVERIEAALLDVVALASSPYVPPPRELYDGCIHAATTASALLQYARHGRRHLLAGGPGSLHVAQASAAFEESRR